MRFPPSLHGPWLRRWAPVAVAVALAVGALSWPLFAGRLVLGELGAGHACFEGTGPCDGPVVSGLEWAVLLATWATAAVCAVIALVQTTRRIDVAREHYGAAVVLAIGLGALTANLALVAAAVR